MPLQKGTLIAKPNSILSKTSLKSVKRIFKLKGKISKKIKNSKNNSNNNTKNSSKNYKSEFKAKKIKTKINLISPN
jgi:hypothetical protein